MSDVTTGIATERSASDLDKSEIHLLFSPTQDVRRVFSLFRPKLIVLFLAGFGWLSGFTQLTWIGLTLAALLTTASWFFFIRVVLGTARLPAAYESGVEGSGPPLRFQPEIKWQAIKIAVRTAVLVFALLALLVAMDFIARETGRSQNSIALLVAVYSIGFPAFAVMFVPAMALMDSRIDMDDPTKRKLRDRWLPKSILQRRSAAVEAYRNNRPEAVPGAS